MTASFFEFAFSRKRLVLIKFFYFLIVSVLFFITIRISFDHWVSFYSFFGIPALDWPGGDARNIQMAYRCRHLIDSDLFTQCVTRAEALRTIYPSIYVPPFNYPEIWIRIYRALAQGDNEAAFLRFWVLVAVAVYTVVTVYAWRFSPSLFPVLLFSPISLLIIERGNIEGLVACLLLLTLLLNTPLTIGIMTALSGGLKIFPAVTAFPYLVHLQGKDRQNFVFGFLIASPFLIWALLDIKAIIQSTLFGFPFSYGVLSLRYTPWLGQLPYFVPIAILSYAVVLAILNIIAWRSKIFQITIANAVQKIPQHHRFAIMASLTLFLLTHLLFHNWAYRLIFLIPAITMLFSYLQFPLRGFALMLLASFLIPILPHGGSLLNIWTLPMSLASWPVLIAMMRAEHVMARQPQPET